MTIDVRDLQQRLSNAGYPVAIDGDIGPKTYAALFAFVGRQQVGPRLIDIGRAADTALPGAAIVTPLRLRHALAQWAVETGGFTRFEENLSYSAQRLCAVWPKRFPTLASAEPFANNPQALANRVYAARMGNTDPGDGWRFRGRGMTMLTGRANYTEASHLTGVDVVANPDLVAQAETGMAVACAFWAANGINQFADDDDIAGVRVKVNGGNIGLDEAKRFYARAAIVIK